METNNNITIPHVENYKPKMNPVFKVFLISACVCILSVITYDVIYFKDSKAIISIGSETTSSDGFVDDSCSVDDSSYKPERIKYNDLSTGTNSTSDKGLSASDKKRLNKGKLIPNGVRLNDLHDKPIGDVNQKIAEFAKFHKMVQGMNFGSGGNDFPDPYREKDFWKPQPVPLNSPMKFYGSSRYDTQIIENPIVTDIRQERLEGYEDGLRKTVFISFPSCFVLLLIIWVIKRAIKK